MVQIVPAATAYTPAQLTPEEIRRVGKAHDAMVLSVRYGTLADWRIGRFRDDDCQLFSYVCFSAACGGGEDLLVCPAMAQHGWTALIRAHALHVAERLAA